MYPNFDTALKRLPKPRFGLRSMTRGVFLSYCIVLSACAINIEKKDYERAEDYVPSPSVKKQIKVKRIWSKNVGSESSQEFSKLAPSVSERGIYTVSESGLVSAWKHKRFSPRYWTNHLYEEISGGVFEGYGMVLLANAEGKVYALDSENGDMVWEQELLGEILSPPQGNGRFAIVQMANGEIHGLNFRTGELVWQYKTTVPALTLRGTSTPVIEKQVVYAGFANGKVVALDISNGAAIWESNVYLPEGGTELEQVVDVDGNLLVAPQKVYAASYQGKVVSLLKQNGRALWKNNASNYLGLEQGLGQIYSVEAGGGLKAYSAESGNTIWEQNLFEGRELSAPAIQLNFLVVGDLEGYLYWVRQSDGEVVAKKYLGRGPIADKSRWNFKGLRHKAQKPTEFRIFAKSVVKDGILYVQNQYGVAAAYQIVE